MLSFGDFLDQHLDPLYISVEPDDNTKMLLALACNQANVPNAYTPAKMHCTLIYSTKPCHWPKVNLGKTYHALFKEWHIFKTQDGKNALVAKLISPQLEERHKELMEVTGGSYDFDQYLPHITVSYDVGDLDLKTISTTLLGDIFLSNESCKVLNQGYN